MLICWRKAGERNKEDISCFFPQWNRHGHHVLGSWGVRPERNKHLLLGTLCRGIHRAMRTPTENSTTNSPSGGSGNFTDRIWYVVRCCGNFIRRPLKLHSYSSLRKVSRKLKILNRIWVSVVFIYAKPLKLCHLIT